MSTADRRHVLVVAVQSKSMPKLGRLQDAALLLRDAFLDQNIGDCQPGLPDNECLLHGELPTATIEAAVKAAIGHAADKGATLVLAILGHGFIAGTDPTLYLMGRDSLEGVRDSAVDIGKLLVEAADRPGVKGVIGIIDTCTAAGAQPRSAELATGTLSGQTRLSLLMASAIDQPAYDMNLARNLADLLRTGLAGIGPLLHLTEVITKLRATADGQNLVSFAYDGDPYAEPLWFAHNRSSESSASSLGQSGTAELLNALKAMDPDREVPITWDTAALHDLRKELSSMAMSPARTRAERIVDSLHTAQKTISFLRSFMAAELNTPRLRRALATVSSPHELPITRVGDGSLITEVDAVEHVALAYPRAEGSCRRQMAHFVLELADDAGLDLDAPELHDWAASIGAIVALNDARSARGERLAERRLRLIVSLHYALAGDWPETLGAWLLYDNEFYQHKDFDCTPDQSGIEAGLIEAVDWAEDNAGELEAPLRRIEIAMPTNILMRWRPEEVEYGQRLGVNYDVLTRWSLRLEPLAAVRRINRNAERRLKEIAALTEGGRINWLASAQVSDTARLREEFRVGRYAGAIGLLDDPGESNALFELLLYFVPILLWPQTLSLRPEHCQRVDSCWNLLPTRFLTAYRARWRSEEADLMADLRAVWDDEDWLKFCRSLQIRPGPQPRSA